MKRRFSVDLGQLAALRVLADHGTVTAAARVLHLSPSAVSQQIAALSRSVGEPLVARHGRRLRLTPQALVLVEHARAFEAQAERARADLAAFSEGAVSAVAVGAFATAISSIVAPALRILSKERPGLSASVSEVEAPECFYRLDSGDLDLAVTVDYRSGPPHGDTRYERVALLADPLYAVLPFDHPLAGRPHVALSMLAEEAWVVGSPGHPCVDITLAALVSASITPRTCHQVNDWEAVASLVAHGAGVALVPALALRAGTPTVAVVPVRPTQPRRSIYAAVRNGSSHAPHIAAVIEALLAAAAACRGPGT